MVAAIAVPTLVAGAAVITGFTQLTAWAASKSDVTAQEAAHRAVQSRLSSSCEDLTSINSVVAQGLRSYTNVASLDQQSSPLSGRDGDLALQAATELAFVADRTDPLVGIVVDGQVRTQRSGALALDGNLANSLLLGGQGVSCRRGQAPDVAGAPVGLIDSTVVMLSGRTLAEVVTWLPITSNTLQTWQQEIPGVRSLVVAATADPRSRVGATDQNFSATWPKQLGATPTSLNRGGQTWSLSSVEGWLIAVQLDPALAGAANAGSGPHAGGGSTTFAEAGSFGWLGVLVGLLFLALVAALAWQAWDLVRAQRRRQRIAAEKAPLDDIEHAKDVQAELFERLGDVLERTHDAEGLGRAVVDAALLGTDGVMAAVFLGDRDDLTMHASAINIDAAEVAPAGARPIPQQGPSVLRDELETAPVASVEPLEDSLHRLGRLAVVEDYPVRVTALPAAGPAVALPLRKDGKVVGALAVARARGASDLEESALAAMTALSSHMGTALSNIKAHEEAKRLSVTDALTGVGNLRQLTLNLAHEVARSQRFGRPLSVLMLDLDHFKAINDTHGHDVGDQVLKEFAITVQACVRSVDTVARYGGEEFVVILPETASDGAMVLGERILHTIRTGEYTSMGLHVTASMGVASYPVHGRDSGEVLRSADAALYVAKKEGRDRIQKAKRVSRVKTN